MENTLWAKHVKIIFCLLAGACLSAIAYLQLQENQLITTLFTALMAGIFTVNGMMLVMVEENATSRIMEILVLMLLWGCSHYLALNLNGPYYWLYFFPLYVFFVFPLTYATFIFTFFIFVTLLPFIQTTEFETQGLILTFFANSLIAFCFAWLNQQNNTLLEPLINMEPETGFYNQTRLQDLLAKEISRAEREGTVLAFLRLHGEHDEATQVKYTNQDVASRIRQFGRNFDSIFRMPDGGYTLILPYMVQSEAQDLGEKILSLYKQDASLHWKITTSGLNVGDTPFSICDRLGVYE